MLTHTDLRKGAQIILDNEPYEVMEASPMKKAQRRVTIQAKLKHLINGNIIERNFHQGDVFDEANVSKFEAKFLYAHRDRYFFAEKDNPAKRFDLEKKSIGEAVIFLKTNQIVEGMIFDGKIINVTVPIKVQLKVTETPPGIRGDRAQGGTKTAMVETGAKVNVPLFVQEGDIIEINTNSGEYVKRVE